MMRILFEIIDSINLMKNDVINNYIFLHIICVVCETTAMLVVMLEIILRTCDRWKYHLFGGCYMWDLNDKNNWELKWQK